MDGQSPTRGAAPEAADTESRFRNMADNAPVMIWVTASDGECTYLSRRWYEYTGQSEEEALGFGWLEATHPEDRPRAEEEFASATRRQAPFRLDYRLRRADGGYGWAIDSAAPRIGPEGEFLGYIGSVIEIDDRKLVEDTLRETEARFRALFSAIDEGYCLCEVVLDAEQRPVDYRFLEANAKFETMTGLTDPTGRTALELVPDLEDQWVQTYADVAFGGEPLRFTQGSAAMGRWFDVFATPVEPHGRFALVFNDVTQRELADLARTRSEAAERRARVQAELLSDLHSELETLDRPEALARRLVALLVAEVADVAIVELPGRDAPWVSEAARDPDRAHSVDDVEVRVVAPIDTAQPELGSMTLGYVDASTAPPRREAEVFVRRVADHVGTIVARARVRDREHEIALQLQEALLPRGTHRAAGTSVAARYAAGSDALEVGGDFYDTFPLPNACVGLSVGDVVGHGLEAAARMGRLRTALTALAPHADGPGQLLSHLDAYAADADTVEFATACCAFLDPATGVVRYASAGHPPMLAVAPDGRTTWLDEGLSPPLHGVPQHDRPGASAVLAPGTLLVLYSDGLVERRGESLDTGLARLEAEAAQVRSLPVEEVCEQLMERLGIADGREDDVVVLCLRTDLP